LIIKEFRMTKVEHLFACVAEEAGEIAQVAGKILRFGAHDTHAKTEFIPLIEQLVTETNDLLGVLLMLKCEGFKELSDINNEAALAAKISKVNGYLHYATMRGKVDE
jgi:hypothetical protein